MTARESWFGSLPPSWEVKRLGALGTLSKGSGGSKEDNRHEGVPVVRYGELYTRFDTVITDTHSFISEDDIPRYTPLPAGSIVFASSGEDPEDIGKSALSLLEGRVVVGGDTVLFTPHLNDINPLFLAYALESRPLKALKAVRATGFTVVHISAGRLKTLPVPIPPLDGQKRIAAFLDQETAQIDALIAKQTQLIDRLHERRASVIANSVESTPSRRSGVRFKHVISSVVQGWSPQCYPWSADGIEKWAVLKVGAVNRGIFRPEQNKELPDHEVPRPEIVVRRGQLVMSRANTRELLGSAAVVEGNYPRLMLSDKLYALTLDEHVAEPRFVASVLGTRRLRDLIELRAVGASPSMQNITQADIMNLPMELPAIADQRRILVDLEIRTTQIDRLIAKAQEFIALARERRSALITAAVTGQIDVSTGKRRGEA